MDKLVFHSLKNEKYTVIITILDYEIRINQYLSELSFSPEKGGTKKAIVDLALKTGVNKYRFVEFDLDSAGKIILNTNNYVSVSEEIETLANRYLQEKKEIVMNSILTDAKKKEILGACG